MNKINFDKVWIGFLAGILIPPVAAYIYYLINFNHLSFQGFLKHIRMTKMYTPLLSISVVGNLAVFYPFIWKSLWNGAKGVLAATFFWAAIIVILKFSL